VFFVLSKIVWWLLAPLNLLLVAQGFGLVLLWRRRRRPGLALITFSTVCLLGIAFTPAPAMLMHALEHRVAAARLPERVDGIVLIGSAQLPRLTAAYGTVHMTANAATMTEFAALARRYPNARRVFAGGSGKLFPEGPPESAVMEMFFREQRLDPTSLLLESRSRNTEENAVFAKELVHPRPEETWVLITAAFHMPRALGVFRKAGWNVIAHPVAYRTLPELSWLPEPNAVEQFGLLDLAMHEWIGLAAYRMTGRI